MLAVGIRPVQARRGTVRSTVGFLVVGYVCAQTWGSNRVHSFSWNPVSHLELVVTKYANQPVKPSFHLDRSDGVDLNVVLSELGDRGGKDSDTDHTCRGRVNALGLSCSSAYSLLHYVVEALLWKPLARAL